jgi:acyl-CoA synthetase (AMP-forming)/AMP-acid ligase II
VSLNAAIRNAVRWHAGRLALAQGERRWTFAELDRAVGSLGAALAARLDRGERVGLFMANRAEYLLLQLALERAGLVRVPLNARYTAFEVAQIVKDCDAAAIFYDRTTAARVEGLGGMLSCDIDGDGDLDWQELLATPDGGCDADDIDDDALCSINYTSGSSGVPKGVVLTRRNWLSVYKNMLIDRGIERDDRLAHVGPLTHASGTYFTPFLLRGAASIIVDGDPIANLPATIQREKITAFTCVPTVLTRLLNNPDLDRHDLSSLRWIGYGAEAIQRNTLDKAAARWGGILMHNYGLTEAMMTCACLKGPEHWDGGKLRYGSIGRPYTFVEIVLRDENGNPVPTGSVGEITIRAEHVMQGYWRRPEETAKVLRDGWLWSGDLARQDADGFLYLVGRSKEMLISGGFNIYPAELEGCLSSCPGVAEAAVIGVPDADFGEMAVAFVVTEPEAVVSRDALIAHCRPRLGLRTPKRWHFVPVLPRTGNGKVDKAALRHSLGEAVS